MSAPPLDVYGQMALDEILSKKEGTYARFFNWAGEGSAATFGYAQPAVFVKAQLAAEGIIEYTRRLTGGGIVLHRSDLTFSLAFKQSALSAAAIYTALHECIKGEFAANGIVLGSYADKSDYRPAAFGAASSCFENPVSDDLLDGTGSKILGGAIRRFGDRILYQGSLQLEGSRSSEGYRKVLGAAFIKYFNCFELAEEEAKEQDIKGAKGIAEMKYKKPLWVEHRRYEENG